MCIKNTLIGRQKINKCLLPAKKKTKNQECNPYTCIIITEMFMVYIDMVPQYLSNDL